MIFLSVSVCMYLYGVVLRAAVCAIFVKWGKRAKIE